MNRRYITLGYAAIIFKLIGVVIWVVTCIAAFLIVLAMLVSPGVTYTDPYTRSTYTYAIPILVGLVSVLATLFVGAIAGLFQFAIGEVIDLLRDIELHLREQSAAAHEMAHYTRKSAQALDYMVSQRNQRRTVTSKTTPPPSD